MPEPTEYKPTLFDRHGPVAGDYVRSIVYGMIAFVLTFGATSIHGVTWKTVLGSIAGGILVGGLGPALGYVAGSTATRFVFGGDTTPYKPQHSYQDALVLQGRVDEALESFEALIAENPGATDVRFRAAELYLKHERSLNRAAELFREVQRMEGLPLGDDVYATNRLVDLLIGPLGNPPRALVELRQLIDRHPGSAAASRARATLAILKARYVAPVQ